MSNTWQPDATGGLSMPPTATRGICLPLVAASASAYASALKNPYHGKIMTGTRTQPATTGFQPNSSTSSLTDRTSSTSAKAQMTVDRASWVDLAAERAGIMEHDGGIPAPLAREKARADTIARFGHCPKERIAA